MSSNNSLNDGVAPTDGPSASGKNKSDFTAASSQPTKKRRHKESGQTDGADSKQEAASKKKNPRIDSNNEYVSMDTENSSSVDIDSRAAKSKETKSELMTTDLKNTTTISTKVNPELLEHARNRLSKFAARLFDPNRPKGLVEPPTIIPLNDEFLTAFGKREKQFDKARGQEKQYEQEIATDDEENDIDNDESRNLKIDIATNISSDKKTQSSTKVKITNLAYRTTEETLTQACLQFGTLSEVHLITDQDQPAGSEFQNVGRAYVTFDTEEAALSCIEGLKSLDGRSLRLSMALMRPKGSNSKGGGGGDSGAPATASLLNKVLEKDISTICFRCGKVGHMESSCPNPAKLKPCPLCGMTDHEQRGCPSNRICFNCGCPGHVNRECTLRRGLPRRMVCGICFQSGHHRLQCQNRSVPRSVLTAICMVCGQKGHFLCKDLKWFYGLRGMSCFNCGSQGHSGYDCQRPTLYQCSQNLDIAVQEIERAEASSL